MKTQTPPRIINKLIVALIVITPFLALPSRFDQFDLPKIIFIKIVCALLVYVAGIYLIDTKTKALAIIKATPSWQYLLSFVALCWGSVFYSISVPSTIETSILITFFVTLFFIAVNFVRADDARNLLYIISATGLINGAYVTIQYFGYDPLLVAKSIGTAQRMRASGMIGNPNTVAGHLVTIFPIALALFFEENLPRRNKRFLLATVLSVIAGIFFTLTFTGIAAAFASAIVVAVALPSKRNKAKIGAVTAMSLVVFIALLMVIPSPFKKRLDKIKMSIISSENKLDQILTGRWFIWRATADVISDFPLIGAGAGAFANSYYDAHASIVADPMETMTPQNYIVNIDENAHKEYRIVNVGNAHNEYLELCANNGFLGLFLLMFAVLSYLWAAIKEQRRLLFKKDMRLYSLIAIIGSITAIMVNSMANFYFHSPASALLGTIVFALCGVLIKDSGKEEIT